LYSLRARLFDGRFLVGYQVSDGVKIYNKTKNEFRRLVQQGLIEDIRIDREGNIKGDGIDLRVLPREQFDARKENSFNCFMGSDLENLCNNQTNKRSRYSLESLKSYLTNRTGGKVCMLYGLRRTGKTIMMLDAIRWLKCYNQCAYIIMSGGDTLKMLYSLISDCIKIGCKYIFIDEVTVLDGFVNSSALLADSYAMAGIHIVLAGTDSFSLRIAAYDGLYDRYVMVNTTYISYMEYSYLLGGIPLMQYVWEGGVLPRGMDYVEYLNTAVVSNIINSIRKSDTGKGYIRIKELDSRGLLYRAVEGCIAEVNMRLLDGKYECRDLGSAKQMLSAKLAISDELTEEITDNLRYSLYICNTGDWDKFNDAYVDDVIMVLEKLNVLVKYRTYVNRHERENYIITQPFLRYNQVNELTNALMSSGWVDELSLSERRVLREKIQQDAEGIILEGMCILKALTEDGHGLVTQYTSDSKEIDLLIQDRDGLHLYEVKRSDKITARQYRWLVDSSFNVEIENFFGWKIVTRNVLYLGGDRIVPAGQREGMVIHYINIEDFLLTE